MSVDPACVSIIVPAFNEGAVIGEVVAALREGFPAAELLVVDDGSADDTAEVATAAGARVLRHRHNRGYGASLRTGTVHATRDHVLFFDGDGQHRVEDAAALLEDADQYDMVVGARGADSHAPLVRRPGKFVLRHFANFLAGQRIPDLNSGLRIFRREVLLRYLHLMPQGFSFSTTSTFAILKSNHSFKYVPIKVEKRVGTSTVSQLRHGPKTLMLMLRLTVLFEPLKVFLAVSGALFTLFLVSLGIDFTLGEQGLGDTSVLLAIASLIVFMFGLLCDQVSAIRRERHEQPLPPRDTSPS